MGSPSALYPKKIDLTNCDKEPIHLIGRIQSHAMLFVIDSSSFEISHISENVISTLSRKREEFFSKPS